MYSFQCASEVRLYNLSTLLSSNVNILHPIVWSFSIRASSYMSWSWQALHLMWWYFILWSFMHISLSFLCSLWLYYPFIKTRLSDHRLPLFRLTTFLLLYRLTQFSFVFVESYATHEWAMSYHNTPYSVCHYQNILTLNHEIIW